MMKKLFDDCCESRGLLSNFSRVSNEFFALSLVLEKRLSTTLFAKAFHASSVDSPRCLRMRKTRTR